MAGLLEAYADVAGEDVIDHLDQLSRAIKGLRVVHVNSTQMGGGVAEILHKLVPLMRELGIDTDWEVVTGNEEFFNCTKSIHNGLQGNTVPFSAGFQKVYEDTNAENAERLRQSLEEADFVFIHDPQPAPLLKLCPARKGKWIWRCHIDLSHPYRTVWRYLHPFLVDYDASVFSLADFTQRLPHPKYIIPPSIDPLSDKNRELEEKEIQSTCSDFGIDMERPLIVQISRFDRFKDPLGVIEAFRLVKKFNPSLQLVYAGGGATDDPEAEAVYQDVTAAAENEPDIFILRLPPDANRTVNALQRAAVIGLQKSTREGFGLTVTEAMWKRKPVIGGDTGGIRLQVINHHTGYLVNSPDGAALRIRYLLRHPQKREEMGLKAKNFVRDNFLLTRHLREYLTLIAGLLDQKEGRIELG
jgi:trehalose synthase